MDQTAAESVSVAARRPLQIALVGAAVALYWISLYLYVPTLSIYALNITNDLGQVGVVVSMYGLWQAVVRLPLGIVADWLGRRKPFILLGFALAGLGAWVMMSAGDFTSLALGRAITGFSAAAWVPLTVMFSSLFPPKEAVRATALLTLINSVARVAATSVTGSLNALGGYGLAFAAAVVVAVLAILVTLPVSETPRPRRRPSLGSIAALTSRRDVLLPAVLSAVFQYVVWATTFGFLPVLAEELNASGEVVSLLTSLNLAVGIGSTLLVSIIVRRTGVMPLLYASVILFSAGTAAAALAQSIPVILLAQVVLGLGYGMGYPLLMGMSIQHVDETERGTAMGLHQAVYAIGMFAGPWLSGILSDSLGIQPMFGITAAATLAVSLVLARVLQKDEAV